MAPVMRPIFKYLTWLLPHGVHKLREVWLAQTDLKKQIARKQVVEKLIRNNERLASINSGKRCFILGNGPSVKDIDLTQLKGELIFSVSNGYLHNGFSDICPKYHCVPQVTYGRMTEHDVVEWFKEMHDNIGLAELFLNESEAELVERYGLFQGRTINYVALLENFDAWQGREVINISKPIPRCQSVPVMALMIAMYMGVKEIILLGVDHSELKTRRYGYPFMLKVQHGKDMSVGHDDRVVNTMHDDLQSYARLWREYRVLRQISNENSIQIINANNTSELDEFPRESLVDYLGRNNNQK